MIEFIIGLAIGMMISNADLGDPVPYKVVKIYNTSAFKHRYMPNAYAIGWNTNDYRYWDTRHMHTPVYTKSIVINKKPKPRPKPKTEDE